MRDVRNTVLLIEDFKQMIQDDIEMKKTPKNIYLHLTARNDSQTETRKKSIKQYLAEGIQRQGFFAGLAGHWDALVSVAGEPTSTAERSSLCCVCPSGGAEFSKGSGTAAGVDSMS